MRLSVTKDTLLVVSPQVLATFCELLDLAFFDYHPHLSFRHVAPEKSIATTCYTGSVSGATSSILPCCNRKTRWQRRAKAKLWVAMREVS